jgi:hypothetical protein
MKTASSKPEAFSRMALDIQKQWDAIQSNPITKSAFEEANPEIKNLDDFTKHRMGIAQEYYGKKGTGKGTPPPGATPPPQGGVVVQTPQGSVRFNTQAEADAYKKRVGLQ